MNDKAGVYMPYAEAMQHLADFINESEAAYVEARTVEQDGVEPTPEEALDHRLKVIDGLVQLNKANPMNPIRNVGWGETEVEAQWFK